MRKSLPPHTIAGAVRPEMRAVARPERSGIGPAVQEIRLSNPNYRPGSSSRFRAVSRGTLRGGSGGSGLGGRGGGGD